MGAKSLALSAVCLFVVSLLAGSGLAWLVHDRSSAEEVSPAPVRSTEPSWDPADSPAPSVTFSSPAVTDEPTPSTSLSPSEPTESAASPTPTDQTTVESEQAAEDELNRLAAADRPSITFDGQPVALLASKYIGLEDGRQRALNGSHLFMAADILAEHQQLKAQFDAEHEVVLFKKRATKGAYRGEMFWYTYALKGFSSKQDVRDFCAREFADLSGKDRANRCVARTLD